jgi:hypothetical protein
MCQCRDSRELWQQHQPLQQNSKRTKIGGRSSKGTIGSSVYPFHKESPCRATLVASNFQYAESIKQISSGRFADAPSRAIRPMERQQNVQVAFVINLALNRPRLCCEMRASSSFHHLWSSISCNCPRGYHLAKPGRSLQSAKKQRGQDDRPDAEARAE